MSKSKYYVVWVGNQPGVYTTWKECEEQVKGFPGAKYKSFPSKEEAEEAFESGEVSKKVTSSNEDKEYEIDSVCVDVGCSGNPGIMEFQCVDTRTNERLFYYGPFKLGTNNIGEFLGIVYALKMLKAQGSDKTIYSDSVTALAWVRNKKVSTNLVRNKDTEKLWSIVEEALEWLRTNEYSNPILKWQTELWGEVKADFGRK